MQLVEASPASRVTPDLLRRAYARLFLQSRTSETGPLAPFEAILMGTAGNSAALSSRLDATRQYLQRLGIPLADGKDQSPGAFFLNGAYFAIDDVSLARLLAVTRSA